MVLKETMPCWYFDKKDLKLTPSIRDGMDIETERRYRKEGTRFIMECGTKMILGHHTIATGAVYFHRFYMFHTFQEFPRYVTACCCLFLAGKVEETPKKCRDIIAMARSMLPDPKFQLFSDDLRKAKEEVMTLESILLQTIKFDLEVEHPYNFLVTYAKCLKGDKTKLQKMVQMAWNFVNDSLSTTVCLQWEPEIIAVALIYLASKLSKFTAIDWIGRQPNHLRWWDMFISDVTMEILEDICHQVLDLYQQSTQSTDGTPSQLIAIKPKVNSPIAQLQLPNDIIHENGTIFNSNFSQFTSIVPPPPPLPIAVQSRETFRYDTDMYTRQIQGLNGAFPEHNVDLRDNQVIAPVPINGDNLHYPAYTANQPNAMPIYPTNPYPSSMIPPSNVPYSMPQCAQQPPHNIYFNQSANRISGAYYPGP